MEAVIIVGILAVIALLGNVRMLAVCALLAIAGSWYYDQMPAPQKEKMCATYNDVVARSKRAWDAFIK